MKATICLLRAVNVSGRNVIRMEALRRLCETLELVNPQTHIQSGNIICGVKRGSATFARRLEEALLHEHNVTTNVIFRTAAEMKEVIARNPFSGRADVAPNRLMVSFLAADPGPAAHDNIRKLPAGPEEVHLLGREVYIYFPDGSGQSKLTQAALDRALKVSGTARNWNTVNKLLELAEKWEAES